MAGSISIPQSDNQLLRQILEATKSNGGAIVGVGCMLAQMNTVLLALLKQGGLEEAELEKLQADLDKLVADFATPDVAGFNVTNTTPTEK